MVFPIWEYDHFTGCSITGGDVYRGSAIPSLQGAYFFADYCFSTIWSLRYDGTTVVDFVDRTAELDPPGSLAINLISSFGQDAAGEMYICDLTGEVFKIIPVPPIGACCTDAIGSCVDLSDLNCKSIGGTWLGSGTQCSDGGCPPPTCPEDINGDGRVDTTDLLAIIGNWGSCTGCSADINGDGSVNTTDLLAVIGNWGSCP